MPFSALGVDAVWLITPTGYVPMTKNDKNNRLSKHELLGFFAHPGSLDDYLALIRTSVSESRPCTVLYHNLHSLYSYFTSSDLQRDYADKTVLVDGMPVIWLMRLAGIPVTRQHRLTYVDFIIPMMELARDNGFRVYHVGQHRDIQEKALRVIREKVPGIEIDGHDGYFDQTPQSADSLDVISKINDNGSNIVLVGFGAPKQEAWVHAHRSQINAEAVFTCGACMEYVAGAVRTPPRWMGRCGLEWSFRVMENPRRFAFRYFVEPVLLAAILLKNGLSAQLRRSRAGS